MVSPMIRLAPFVVATLLASAAQAETCRFTGSSNHDGRLTARSEVTQSDGLVTVDVTLDFTVSAWVSEYRYLGQEISTWRGNELVALAINQRSFSGGAVVRQQWDVFTRRGDALEASRVQAKRLTEFRQRHPGFVRHWPAAAFGKGWLADYPPRGPGAPPRPRSTRRRHQAPARFRLLLEPLPPAVGQPSDAHPSQPEAEQDYCADPASRDGRRRLGALVSRSASSRPDGIAYVDGRGVGLGRTTICSSLGSTFTPIGQREAR